MSHIHSDSHDYLLVFGGEDKMGNISNELWLFNISSSSWSLIESINNSVPIATSQHAACVVGDGSEVFVFVYGGKVTENGQTILSPVMQRFGWTSKSWEKISANSAGVSDAVLSRAGHTMVYDRVSSSLIVYGGHGLPESSSRVQRSRKLLVFDLNRFLWIEIPNSESLTTATLPTALAFHSATVVGDFMIVFGGSTHTHNQDESCHDDSMYFYNLRCRTWSRRPFSDDLQLEGRFAHVAALAHENVILVQGGYNGVVLGDLLAYKVPLFANRNLPNVCNLHRSKNFCDQDQRCVWEYRFGCLSSNQSFADASPICPRSCNEIKSCTGCVASNRFANYPRSYVVFVFLICFFVFILIS